MRPKKHETKDLFRARLDQIIHMKHELVQLAASYRRQDRAALQRRRPARDRDALRHWLNLDQAHLRAIR